MTTGSAKGTGPAAGAGVATATPELSVLIVNYNSWTECAAAIASLRQHGPARADGTAMPFECIVVDNLSPRREPAAIAAVERELLLLGEQQHDPRAGRLILHDENGGYSKGMNLACRHSRGRWLLVSNPDVVFGPGLISRLLRQLEADARAGITVPKGYWDLDCTGHLPPNTMPTLGEALVVTLAEYSRAVGRCYLDALLRRWLRVWQAERPLALPMMSGCLFLVERGFFASVGQFDERYPLYYEDADLSRAIRAAGRTITQVPDAQLVHFVNRSGMTDLPTMWARHATSRQAYFAKWYGRAGLAVLRWLERLQRSERLRRWRKAPAMAPFLDLGESSGPPRLEFGRACTRFVVLLSLDARFFLAAGTFGSGDHWTPGPGPFAQFVDATYFFVAFDLDRRRPRRLGAWRYRCRSHLGRPLGPAEAT